MSAIRDRETGTVIDDVERTPAVELFIMDAGDNIVWRGTPDKLEWARRRYGSYLEHGRYTLISMP